MRVHSPCLGRGLSRAGLLAPLCLALAACSTTPRGSQNAYRGSEGSHETQEVEGNQILARNLSIRDPRSRREDDRLVVQFELANTRSNALSFAWTVDWYDQAGFHVQDSTRHWRPEALGGFGSTTLTITAPTREATSWKLQVTSPDEVH